MQLDEYTLVDFFKILWRRKWLWIILPVIFVLGASFYLKSKPDQYVAEGELQVDPPPEGMTFILSHWTKEAGKQEVINKAVELYKKTEASNAGSNLISNFRFTPSPIPFDPGHWGKLAFVVQGPDPEIAKKLCELWMGLVIDKGRDDIRAKLEDTVKEYDRRYEKLSELLLNAREKRDAFFREKGLIGLDEELEKISKEIKKLDKNLNGIQVDFEKVKVALGAWENQLKVIPPGDRETRLYVTKKILRARSQLESFPKLIKNIGDIRKQLKASSSDLIHKKNRYFLEIQRHKAIVRNAFNLIGNVANDLSLSRINSQTASNTISLFSEAYTSGVPIPTRDSPKIVAAGVTGFVMAIILALVLESFSSRRREDETVSQ